MTAFTAYFIWGAFPLYFKQLQHYDSVEIIVHRVVWTFVLLSLVLLMARRRAWLGVIRQNPKWLLLTFVAALLIAINWLAYVWAVNHNQVLEASLGYFINPLMGVALSVMVFKERLAPLQLSAVALAISSVLVQLIWLGGVPWVSLVIAGSFAFYGVLQRLTPFDAIDGLFLETLLLLPLGFWWLSHANVASADLSFWTSSDVVLLMLSGPITLLPLLLYNLSTKMVSFAHLSFVGYLAPSMVFLLAVFYYREPFSTSQIITFILIWSALALFSLGVLRQSRIAKSG